MVLGLGLDKINVHVIPVRVEEGVNIIIGKAHFIKTVEDLYETLIESSPCIKFGVAFCESSGKRLVRHSGNDADLEDKAIEIATKIAAGHCFIVLLRDAYPINVLNRIKAVSEVVTLYCATANPIEVVIVETGQGRAIMAVVDGYKTVGVEDEEDKRERMEFLRNIGYKSKISS